MEIQFFMLRFKICIRGLGLEIMEPFLRFLKMGLFVKSLQFCFLRDLSSNHFK